MAVLEIATLLPFFLVLALVYGSLEVSGIFKNKGVKGVIAIVLAFFAVSSPPVVAFINEIMPYIAVFFIVVFLAGFLSSFFKGKGDGKERDWILIVIILALGLIFLTGQDSFSIFTLQDQNFIAMAVLLVIVLLFYGVYKIKGT